MPTRVSTSSKEVVLVRIITTNLSIDEVLEPPDDHGHERRLRHHAYEGRRVRAVNARLDLVVDILVSDVLTNVFVEPALVIVRDALHDVGFAPLLVTEGQHPDSDTSCLHLARSKQPSWLTPWTVIGKEAKEQRGSIRQKMVTGIE